MIKTSSLSSTNRLGVDCASPVDVADLGQEPFALNRTGRLDSLGSCCCRHVQIVSRRGRIVSRWTGFGPRPSHANTARVKKSVIRSFTNSAGWTWRKPRYAWNCETM